MSSALSSDAQPGPAVGAVALLAVMPVGAALVAVRGIGPVAVALVLTTVVAVAAAFGGRSMGVFAAVIGALSFNFFHIRPFLVLSMDTAADFFGTVAMFGAGVALTEIVNVAVEQRGRDRRQWRSVTPRPTVPGSRRDRRAALDVRRQLAGIALAVLAAGMLTAVLLAVRDHVGLPSVVLLFVLVVVAATAVGGLWAGLVAAVGSSILVNWYFTPPFHRWHIAEGENVLALAVFLAVAATISAFVSTVARQSDEAARARAEAETLVAVAASSVADDPVAALLGRLCEAFSLDGAAILSPCDDGWRADAASGEDPPATPEDATALVSLGDDGALAVTGAPLRSEDRRLLDAFAAQLAASLRTRRLSAEATRAAELAQVNELRSALLAAVSHDLRTPLAAIKAAVTSLLADDVDWDAEQVREFCHTINSESDRLNNLVGNLLDMSRVTTGTVEALLRPVGMEEVVPAALRSLGGRVDARQVGVDVEVPETLPRVRVDPALFERAVANLIDNALAWSPAGTQVRVDAVAVDGRVDLRIADHGPGIPSADRERMFLPFQRRGDRSNGAGVGLGLAVAKGFVEVMHGSIEAEGTPGGGLTMVVSLPVAP